MALSVTELHAHLYGCLTADDLWNLGKTRWHQREAALEWYAAEYSKAWQRTPDWRQYWTMDGGRDLLAQDFLCMTAQNFARFQACFNLMIALVPIEPTDTTVVDLVLPQLRNRGLEYVELRTFVPVRLDAGEIDVYLRCLTSAFARWQTAQFQPRLVLSVPRLIPALWEQYSTIRTWMNANPLTAQFIVGLDFCGEEEPHPPIELAEFFTRVRADNQKYPQLPLALLYHVGESFTSLTLASSARRVWEAWNLGAHRLGHGVALGLDPFLFLGASMQESVHERLYHLNWLMLHEQMLLECGHTVNPACIEDERTVLRTMAPTDRVNLTVDEDVAVLTRSLQDALLFDLARRGAVIETCPTSNLRICRIPESHQHPLRRFLDNGLNVVLCTDDPGIFATSMEEEEALCLKELGVTPAELQMMAQRACALRART